MHEATEGCHRCNATKPFVRSFIRPVEELTSVNITCRKKRVYVPLMNKTSENGRMVTRGAAVNGSGPHNICVSVTHARCAVARGSIVKVTYRFS